MRIKLIYSIFLFIYLFKLYMCIYSIEYYSLSVQNFSLCVRNFKWKLKKINILNIFIKLYLKIEVQSKWCHIITLITEKEFIKIINFKK